MLMPDKTRANRNPVSATYTLSRNNLEFAGLVVYFFALTIIFAITLIVMLFQPRDAYARAANDHRPPVVVSLRSL
jgi:hypothetical protein